MYKIKIIIILTFTISYFSCKKTNPKENSEITTIAEDSLKKAESEGKKESEVTIFVWVDRLRLREKPDTKSEVMAELKEGSPLIFLNEKSDFTDKINLRGTLFDEPWLKVETAAGIVGWVYGGGVKFYKPQVDAAPSPYEKCFRYIKDENMGAYHSCIETTRQRQLRKDTRFVTKASDGLVFTLLTGEQKKMTNIPPTAEIQGEAYEYITYFKKMGYFVVETVIHEGGEFILINDKSGKETRIFGFPKMSPDAKHLVSTSADLSAGFYPNGVQIFGFGEEGFEKMFEEELDLYEPILPKWIDEKTVEITLRPNVDDTSLKQKIGRLIMLDKGIWVFDK